VIDREQCDATERTGEHAPEGKIRAVARQLEEEGAQHSDERARAQEETHEGLEDDEEGEHRQADQLPEDDEHGARDSLDAADFRRFRN